MLLSLVVSAFFQLQALAQNKDILATVGNKTITVQEFDAKYKEVRAKAINPPTREQFLEDYIRYHIGLQEAQKKNLQNDPVVKEQMEQALYKGLLERELSDAVNKIQISEAEMREYYKNNPELRSSHILIELKMDATPEQRAEAKKRAEEIFKEVKASKRPFEELVKLYSDDALTKANGGDLGFQSRATLIPSFYETLRSMKIGEIRGVIESPYGYHIVKLTGIRSYENADKRQLRAQVFDLKRKKIFDQYFEKLKQSYPVKISTEALNKATR
jgi:peptidyl-prolyl cis-trans isomerase C/peptidyl-prolyl cis-trans isomerase D